MVFMCPVGPERKDYKPSPVGDTFVSLVTSLQPFTVKVHPGCCYAKQRAHAALVNQQSFRGVVAMGTRTLDFVPHLEPPGATVSLMLLPWTAEGQRSVSVVTVL